MPVVDGGVGHPRLGRVQVFVPGEHAACLECTWGAADYRLAAAARQQRDAAEAGLLAPLARSAQPRAPEDRRDHDVHLELRERRAEAAAHPAAERDPRVGLGGAVEKALGAERLRIRRI